MKSIDKKKELEFFPEDTDLFFDYRQYYKALINEKNIGKFGDECRFLVKIKDSFQNRVNNSFYFNYSKTI